MMRSGRRVGARDDGRARALTVACAAFAIAGVLALGWAASTAAGQARTTNDGVYTREQAERGEKVYLKVCAECHQPEQFRDYLRRWVGLPVEYFYQVLRATMPENNPGGLTRQEYADVLSYVFAINGTPPGEQELGVETEQLEAITIVAPPEEGAR